MRVGRYLLQEFSDGHAGREVTELDDALRVLLVESGGSVSALARELGRPRRTVRNWLAGTRPRGGGGSIIDAAARAQRRAWLSADREDELRHGFDNVMAVGGTLTVSNDPEPRHIEIEYVSGWGDQLIDAYLDGASANELETLWADSITDQWYSEHLRGDGFDIDTMGWFD